MDQVAQIRETTDIISLISEFIALKKAGRNFRALCPFHKEDSPSFFVSPERQIWHCFGCNKGGDVYTFLMEYERMEFPEALRVLAKRAGINLVQSTYLKESASKKEKIYDLNKIASEFYHFVLTKHTAGKQALLYLQRRGVDERLMRTFGIGFAPVSGRSLVSYLIEKKGYIADDLIEAGLVFGRGQRVFDFFTNRIIFPLTDHRGNILGFSGRALDDMVKPKYINTRDTLVYRKGEVFFGFNITKDAVKKADEVVVTEGEFDVISLFREGIGNVVGIKGTALTKPQAQLLSRFAKRVVLCLDNDTAGIDAMYRSIPILENQKLIIHAAQLEGAKDPDEAIRTNPAGFKKALAHHQSVYDYLLERAVKNQGVVTVEQKRAVSDVLLPLFTVIQNEIVKEHYLRKLSAVLGSSFESVLKESEKLIRKEKIDAIPIKKIYRSREELLEEYLLAVMLSENISVSTRQAVKDRLLPYITKARNAEQKLLLYIITNEKYSEIPSELIDVYNISLLYPLPVFTSEKNREKEIMLVISALEKLYTRKKIHDLSAQMKQTGEENISDAAIDQTLSQLSSLIVKA